MRLQIDTCLARLDDVVASRCTGGPSSSGKQDELGVILTGSCLAAMSNAQKIRFVDAAYPADTVICCRLTPDQKAELVQVRQPIIPLSVRKLDLFPGNSDVGGLRLATGQKQGITPYGRFSNQF
jgi:hypothetical protein